MSAQPSQYVSKARTASREGKGQKARLIIADAISTLDYMDALEFVRLVKIDQGSQDLALLPECAWTFHHNDGDPRRVYESTDMLRAYVDEDSDYAISWPSVFSHWGVSVCTRYGTFYSPDYALTETYLCS
jgi:hypothetical protein